MRLQFIHKALICALFYTASNAFAAIEPLAISSEDNLSAGRWMFASNPDLEIKRLKSSIQSLAQIKRAQATARYSDCVTEAQKAWSKFKGLDPWLMTVRLDCAIHSTLQNNKLMSQLSGALSILEKYPEWLLVGPYSSSLRTSLVEARLLIIEIESKMNRKLAWEGVENLQSKSSWFNEAARAKFYRLIGELSFSDQKLEAAREYFSRSLKETDSDELRKRLGQIDAALILKKPKKIDKALPTEKETTSHGGDSVDVIAAKQSLSTLSIYDVNVLNEQSSEEQELASRIAFFIRGGDYLGATAEAVKLIQRFPGSVRAKWAQERIIEVYLNISERNDSKYDVLKHSILLQMFMVDSERQYDWAKTLNYRGFSFEALELMKKALSHLEPSARTTKFLELGAHAAYLQDQFDEALKFYNEIILKHSGTSAFREALFKSALIYFRQRDFPQSVNRLERLLSVPQSENFELQARYWLWRSLQNLKSDRAHDQAQVLVEKFPLSYYGLRARIELNNGYFEMKYEKSAKTEASIWITNKTRLNWERAQILIQAGWIEEAQADIKELPAPTSPEEKVLRARVLAAALNYGPAIKLVNEAWEEEPGLRQEMFFGIAFPKEFQVIIEENSKLRGLSPNLVRGLIKQESAFQIKAISSSNAYGLMQMIPPTAKEIASDLKIEHLELPQDMFNPGQNIRMGTYYLAKVLKQFNNHVPLALASYNAGPARMERFLKLRPSLANLMAHPSSNPDDEIWFDELPWSETSFYVKAILRNFILYQSFDLGRVSISNPIWTETKEKL